MGKSLLSELTHRSYSKTKNSDGTRTPQLRVGIEARIDYHPFLDDWGDRYQSIMRTALNELQHGQSEDNVEKTFQGKFDIDWAWADSIATDAKGTYDQLTEARALRIKALDDDLKAGWKSVASTIELMEQQLANPTRKNMKGFAKRLMGLESKVNRLERKQTEKEELEKAKRLHVCFGSAKLFNAQYHLEENGYVSYSQWRADWEKKRGGNFYSVGKGSVSGNNPVAKIFYIQDDIFSVTFTVPRFLCGDYGDTVSLEFEVSGQRKHNLLYALESGKPVTVQCFRREHKQDQWYIHLTTYVQDVPTISSRNNGCIGIDLNAETIDVIYIKRDGNPERCRNAISFPIPTGTTGQKEARLRDIVIIQLPTDEFFNTGIYTYLWVLNKHKSPQCQDKVMLINASEKFKSLKKNKGSKRKEVDEISRLEIVETLKRFVDNDYARVFDKEFFYFNKQAIMLTNVDEQGKTFASRLKEGKTSVKLAPLKLDNGERTLTEFTITNYDLQRFDSLLEAFEQDIKPFVSGLDYKEQPLKVMTDKGLYWFDADRETLVKETLDKQEALGCGKIVVKAAFKKGTKTQAEKIEITVELAPDYQKDYEIIPFHQDEENNKTAIEAFMAKYITITGA